MCVAVVVTDERPPTVAELEAMENANPHGAGIAWPDIRDGNPGWRYFKGVTAADIAAILPQVPRPALLHFRWATHGPKADYLCHPFPVGDRALEDPAVDSWAPKVLIHNGVWTEYWRHLPSWARRLDPYISDTTVMAYVAEQDESILETVSWSTAVGKYNGNTPSVTTRGRWMTHNNNQFSNMSWQVKNYRRK